jgi:hypothetical protein
VGVLCAQLVRYLHKNIHSEMTERMCIDLILYAGITQIRLMVSDSSGHILSLTPQAPMGYLVVHLRYINLLAIAM